MPKILLPLADGFEDIEAAAVIDVLRRAGTQVVTCGTLGNIVLSKSGVRWHADERLIDLEDFAKFDGIVLIGGPGVENLSRSDKLMRVVEGFGKQGKLLAALSHSPSILVKLGLLKDRRATIFPGLEKHLEMPRSGPVVVDGNIITGTGPGAAISFALKIVEQLYGRPKAAQIKEELVA